jgi:hypothetical protein
MPTYAKTTDVSAEKSRMEIELTVKKYGASGFMSGWQGDSAAMVAFNIAGRSVRFVLPMPLKTDKEITHYKHSGGGWILRSAKAMLAAHDQACRQRWRALALCIKAKLEAVECRITSIEHEFLAHFIAHDGRTVAEHVIPQLTEGAPLQLLLPGPKGP